MKDDRTAKIQQLLSIAGQEGQSAFPGGRPRLITWLGQQLDAHPGDAGHEHVAQRLQQRLVELRLPQALTPGEITWLRHDAQHAGQLMKDEIDRQKR